MSFRRFLFPAVSIMCLAPFAAIAQAPASPAGAPAIAVSDNPPVTAAGFTPPASSPSAPVTHGELPALVKEAILNDPDIIMQAAQKLRDKQAAEGQKQMKDSLEKHKADLFDDPNAPSVGDAKTADVTVVEFFDYHCGYCKHMLPAITQLIKEDKKARVVFREFPILTEDSVTASRAALAVYRIAPDKYFDFHTALMQSSGKFDEKTLFAIAKKQGISTEKLKSEMGKEDITAELDKNRAIGEDMGIRGTPALIIGDQLMPGAMPYEDLKRAVDEARNGKKPAAATPPKG